MSLHPADTVPEVLAKEIATFGAGCFWGPQASFDKLPGILETTVGYMGGRVDRPTYEQVCSHATGHAEVVKIVFDPKAVSYETLVRHFFSIHDPTQVNRQGPDVGDQYRSVIFTYSDQQHMIVDRLMLELQKAGKYSQPIATEIEPAHQFWPAEGYHQKYVEKGGKAAC